MNNAASPGLSQVHGLVRDLLAELDRVCRARGIRYFLAYGTEQGAVRDADIIPWDVDADVWVMGEDLAQLVAALQADLDPRFELLTPTTHPDYEYLFPRLVLRGIHHVYLRVDLFPLDPGRRWRWTRWLHMTCAHLICQMWFVRRADTGVRHHYSPRKRAAARALGRVARLVPESVLLWAFTRLRGSGRDAMSLLSSCGSYGLRERFARHPFDNPECGRLGAGSYLVPARPESILRDVYGCWEVPVGPERQRQELEAAERDFVAPLRALGVID